MKDVRWRCSREEKYYDWVISGKIEEKKRRNQRISRGNREEKKRGGNQEVQERGGLDDWVIS